MTSDQRTAYERNYLEARRILLLFDSRLLKYHETRGHALDLSRVTGGGSGQRDVTRLDPLEAWCLTVAWALCAYGRPVARVLYLRLTRRQKSAENSWQQIATEMGDTSEHVERTFRAALPVFLLELESRNVGVSVHEGGEELPTLHALRCAAEERGIACTA